MKILNKHFYTFKSHFKSAISDSALVALITLCISMPFATHAQITFGMGQENPFSITHSGGADYGALVDLDDDGDLDMMYGSPNGNFYYSENTGTAFVPDYAARVFRPFSLDNIGGTVRTTASFVDLDDDGDLDLLSGDTFGGFYYFPNNGTVDVPVFGAALYNPFSLTDIGSFSFASFVDLDGDGDYDVLSGAEDGNFYYFENIGSISLPNYAAAISNPYSLIDIGVKSAPAFVDLDEDGDMDLMAGENNGDFKYFENTGDANNPVFPELETNPFSLANLFSRFNPSFGDMDGDGDIDMIAAKTTGDIIHFSNRKSELEAITDSLSYSEVVVNPYNLIDIGGTSSPYLVDLDGDGDLDIMCGEFHGNFKYFENTGTIDDPDYAAPTDNPFGLVDVGGFSRLSFGDLDDDDDYDLVVGNSAGDIKTYINTGNVNVPLFTFSSSMVGYGGVISPYLIDIDNDGDLDILQGNSVGTFGFIENTGNAAAHVFAAFVTNPFSLGDIGAYSAPILLDCDNDGDYDIISGEADGEFYYMENIGTKASPNYSAARHQPFSLENLPIETRSYPTYGDIDNDGDIDLISGAHFGELNFFKNNTPLPLVPIAPSFLAAVANPFSLTDIGDNGTPEFVDLDDDGDLDMMSGASDGDFHYFENIGTSSVPDFDTEVINPFGLATGITHYVPSFADLDNDGDYDMMSQKGGNFKYFENTGTADAPAFAAPVLNPFSLPASPAWGTYMSPHFADFDDDGKYDIVMGSSVGNIGFYRNVGTLASADYIRVDYQNGMNQYIDIGDGLSFSLGDLDNDGDLDMISAERVHSDIHYFENKGTAQVPVFDLDNHQTNPFSISNVHSKNFITFVDLDADGDLDLMLSEDDGNFYYYENTPIALLNTWTGTTSSDWKDPSNWSKEIVPIDISDVIIANVANDPIITSDVIVASLEIAMSAVLSLNENSLTVKNDLSLHGNITIANEASFIPMGTVAGLGSATINRNTTYGIAEGKYSVIGSPITAGNTSSLGDIIYSYDETIAYDPGVSNGSFRFVEVVADEVMAVSDAYFSANTGDISFTGMPNSGAINTALIYDEANDGVANAGFNLVSNPYTAAISYDKFIALNPDIEATLYFWDDGGSASGARSNSDYITANSLGAAGGGSTRTYNWDKYIRSTQGFFVKATTADTLHYTPSMMSTGDNFDEGYFRTEKPTVLRFSISSENYYNDILIGFNEAATLGYDRALDAHKVKGNSSLQLYSKMNDAIYAIQALPILSEEITVDLGMDIAESGTYTFNINDASSYNFKVYLKDNQLNELIDLAESNSYSFETSEVSNSDRFSLVFSPSAVLNIEDVVSSNDMIVFTNGNMLNIRMDNKLTNATVNIYDISGVLVKSIEQVEFTGSDWSTSFSKNGLFIVTVQSEGHLSVKKLIK